MKDILALIALTCVCCVWGCFAMLCVEEESETRNWLIAEGVFAIVAIAAFVGLCLS